MDNEKKIKEYFEKWKGVKLSGTSRARMREELLAHAQFHKTAVRAPNDSRSIEQVERSASRLTRFISIRFTHMTAAILIAVMIGGGTTYAAQGTAPGDFLYPVKTEVNENIRSAFAFSNEAEAALQAKLAAERLEEAEALAARGELDAETSAHIRARLQNHYNEATERSARAEAEGDVESSTEVRASLEGAFRAYADVLSQLNADIDGNESGSLILDLETFADEAANARATATVDTSVEGSVNIEALITRVGERIEDLQARLARIKDEISASAHARIEARLTEAARVHAEAKVAFREGLYREAYDAAGEAIRLANEVESMIGTALRLDVDIDLPILDTRGEADVNTEDDEATTDDDNSDRDTETENKDDSDTGIDVDVEVDGEVDTDVLDTNVESDAEVGATGRVRL